MSRVIVSIVLNCLKELSDTAYQKRVWNASSGPEISSFTEAKCQLFDDSGLGVELDKEQTVFSPTLDRKLRLIRSKLSSIEEMRSPDEIIDDPKMQIVRELCQGLLEEMVKGSDL